MVDEVKALSAQLAQEPQSLVFLRLGELLRQRRQLDAAKRVALSGLERHPHLADAHDLYARILADRHDYEKAFDEWDMTLRIAPEHTGAMKGLAFLYFKVGDLAQAESHLKAAKKVTPDDFTIEQALEMMRGGAEPAPPVPAAPPPAPDEQEAKPLAESRVFAGLEGAEEGLLLLDAAGLVLGGGLKSPKGDDVTEAVAAYLAGVSQEAARTAKLLGLGAWRGLSAEGHPRQPRPECGGRLAAAGDAGPLRTAGAAGDRGAARGPGRPRVAGATGMTAASFEQALDQVTRVPGVRGAMLVTGDDGLVVAEHLMEGIRGPAVAALAASLATRLRRAMQVAGTGSGQFWQLLCEQGGLMVVPGKSGILVVAITAPDVNAGLVRLELLRAAEGVA